MIRVQTVSETSNGSYVQYNLVWAATFFFKKKVVLKDSCSL